MDITAPFLRQEVTAPCQCNQLISGLLQVAPSPEGRRLKWPRGDYVIYHVAGRSSGPQLTLPVGWQAGVKWSRLTGDVETSAERGKTRRSLYLSQSKVSIDHLIQHCRPLQTFIIGVSGDSLALAQSAATHCLLQRRRD